MLEVYAWPNLQCVHGSMTPKLSDMDIDFWTDHISQVPLLLDWIYFPVNAWAAMIARSKQCCIALLLGWGPVIVFPGPKLQHYHFAFDEAGGKWKLIGDVHLAHRLWNMISSLERRMADQIHPVMAFIFSFDTSSVQYVQQGPWSQTRLMTKGFPLSCKGSYFPSKHVFFLNINN